MKYLIAYKNSKKQKVLNKVFIYLGKYSISFKDQNTLDDIFTNGYNFQL